MLPMRELKAGIADAGPPLDVVVSGVGHAHIDVAWLWTLSQTRKKTARSFSTALRLMERYPEFKFTQSQPQLYQYIAEDHPELMAEIKQRVAEGRWETIGGMWVEADCNITGAEALARQFVLGRQYFLDTFGARESPILWLPDVFGYAWQLPQLIQGAGLSYFVTAKLSWNQYNRMPYDQFWWQGLDGTNILTYFITTSKPGWWGATYSADLSPEEIIATWDGSQQKELCNEFMIAYGHGDGGGGPTQAMLDRGREMAAHPGLPQVKLSTAIDFMERLWNVILVTSCRPGMASSILSCTGALIPARRATNAKIASASSSCMMPNSWRRGPRCMAISPIRMTNFAAPGNCSA